MTTETTTTAYNPRAYRTTITVTVFSRDPILPLPPEGDDLYDPLSALIYDMAEGDKIGDWTLGESVPVEGDDLVTQLVAIGNDGSFFGDEEA